jgi:hypothetical protein
VSVCVLVSVMMCCMCCVVLCVVCIVTYNIVVHARKKERKSEICEMVFHEVEV